MPHPITPVSLCCRLQRALVALGMALLTGLPASSAAAAAPGRDEAARPRTDTKRFDIPAGEAFAALKRFSAQSGEQLIYEADTLEGVRTATVRGQFTPREALTRMLVRTELTITQDGKTGTLAITRTANSGSRKGQNNAASGLTSTTKKKSPPP